MYSSIGMGIMNNFRNLNSDLETYTRTLSKDKVTGVNFCVCKGSSQSKCLPNNISVAQMVWKLWKNLKPKRRFLNLNVDPEVKVNVTGVQFFECMGRSCLPNIKGVAQMVWKS